MSCFDKVYISIWFFSVVFTYFFHVIWCRPFAFDRVFMVKIPGHRGHHFESRQFNKRNVLRNNNYYNISTLYSLRFQSLFHNSLSKVTPSRRESTLLNFMLLKLEKDKNRFWSYWNRKIRFGWNYCQAQSTVYIWARSFQHFLLTLIRWSFPNLK